MKKAKTIAAAATFWLMSLMVQAGDNLPQSPIHAPAIPDEVNFCGDTVRLDNNEYLRERFDREIINFTFGHSTTLQILKRANKYMPRLEALLKAENMPNDLKYLAAIESCLDPRAASGVGAGGMWQIMPETAKENGLEISDGIDERYNIEKSTQAACKYLRSAYKRIGDWASTAASYNTGRARVIRQKDKQKASTFYEMLLSEETNRYVFRILALKTLMENPKKYGYFLDDKDLYQEVPCDTIGIDTTLNSLGEFAKSIGIDYRTLKEENPWLRSTNLPDANGKHYVLRVPKAAAEKARKLQKN